MSLSIINQAMADNLATALCNTLLYSLVQGIILAIAAGLIIVLTRKVSAAIRYNLLVVVLVLFAASSVVTFVIQLQHIQPSPVVQPVDQIQTEAINVIQVNDNSPAQPLSFTQTISDYLNAHHSTIVLIWFLIICAKSIQLATGLQGVYRLKRTKIYEVAEEWQHTFQRFASSLGIAQKIQLLESGLAKVPMVIGHLKPVILIPVGLLTALSTGEVEAILMHELAHIRRRDYLVNLLQSLVEIVFFFNPAVLWVSQLIKTEREHCCDDIALAQNTSRSQYIRALVSCQEYQASPAFAMAFPGQKNHLLGRVKRLVTNRNNSLDMFEKTLLAVCLVMSGLCLSAYTEKDNIKKMTHAVVTAIKHTALRTEKKLSPHDKTAVLDNKTAQRDNKTAEADSVGAELAIAKSGTPPPTEAIDTTKKVTQQNQPVRVSRRVDSIRNTNVSTNSNGRLSSLPALGQLNLNHRIDSINTQIKLKTNITIQRQKSYLDSANQYRKQAKTYTALPVPPHTPYNTKRIDYKPYVTLEDNARRDEAINDMLKDGLIKTRDNLSFKISNKEFIVNYQKQPDELFQKYKAKYVKKTGGDWSWMYNYDTDKRKESNTIIDNPKN